MKDAKFISMISDGSTDPGIIEQEIVFIRFCIKGQTVTKFVAVKNPSSPNAVGVYIALLNTLQDLDLYENDFKKKLVRFGCDGANVMVGKKKWCLRNNTLFPSHT